MMVAKQGQQQKLKQKVHNLSIAVNRKMYDQGKTLDTDTMNQKIYELARKLDKNEMGEAGLCRTLQDEWS
jgi:hypothetical protein